MNPERPPSVERLMDLLADQTTQGLSAEEQKELQQLLVRWPHVDAQELETTTAILHQSMLGGEDPLPQHLRARLEEDALVFFQPDTIPSAVNPNVGKPSFAWLALSGWLSTAVCLGLLIWSQWPREAPVRSLNEEREQLLANANRFSGQSTDLAVSGNVVWNNKKQQGFLEVTGLKPNDPKKSQYQLWIIDAGRPDSPPIDGGVFDITAESNLVRIQSKLQVFNAKIFAITEEQPGGVVISKNEKLLILTENGG